MATSEWKPTSLWRPAHTENSTRPANALQTCGPFPSLDPAPASATAHPYSWWRFYKRLLLSNAVVERGWNMYVGALVVFIVACLGSAAVCTWLTFVLKTRTKFRLKW